MAEPNRSVFKSYSVNRVVWRASIITALRNAFQSNVSAEIVLAHQLTRRIAPCRPSAPQVPRCNRAAGSGADPLTNTLATSGNITVNAADAPLAFAVSTPAPVTLNNGQVQGGVIQLSTSDTDHHAERRVERHHQVTSNGQTANHTETVEDFRSLAGA
jgi:hypothetical protein